MQLRKECKYRLCPLLRTNNFPWVYIIIRTEFNYPFLLNHDNSGVSVIIQTHCNRVLSHFKLCPWPLQLLGLIGCVELWPWVPQGHSCNCSSFTLSLVVPTTKVTYLICWVFVYDTVCSDDIYDLLRKYFTLCLSAVPSNAK